MEYRDEFDAVFSNAALHWMLDREAVLRGVSAALKVGGRFVAELGGRGNIASLESAVESVARRYLGDILPDKRTYYPSLGEYAVLLEEHSLEVRFATLFDRPTKLEGEAGMEDWVRQFRRFCFESLPSVQASKAIREVAEELRSSACRDGVWIANYRRLRFVAVKI